MKNLIEIVSQPTSKHFDKISRAMGGDRSEIETMVRSGEATMWKVADHSYAITRYNHDTLFFMCYEGRDVLNAVQAFINYGVSRGCGFIRFDTRHRWLLHHISRRYHFSVISQDHCGKYICIASIGRESSNSPNRVKQRVLLNGGCDNEQTQA